MAGRLTAANKAQRTKKLKQMQNPQGTKQKLIPYSIEEHEKLFITPEKIQVLNLPYKHIIWLGAKDGGKTRPVVTRMAGMLTTNPSFYGLALKKYKTNATSRLHIAISNMAIEIRRKGYDIPVVQKGQAQSYFMKDTRWRENNQTVEYASLDDMDGIAGIEAPNLGQFAIVHVEEPVMSGDKEQPSHEDFWAAIKILESSVARSNRRYAELNDAEPMYPTYHYTMNAWDDHPLVVEAEKVFPENDFLNKCLGVKDWEAMSTEELDEQWEDMKKSLQENTTAVVADTATSKAFVRLTFFANPTWHKSEVVYNPALETPQEEQLENFWNGVKEAIHQKDYITLAIYLGLKQQKANDGKTYQTTLLQTADTLKMIKEEGWETIGTSQGWDVDINRLFVDTPVVLGRKQSLMEGTSYKLFVLPQQSFPAYGDGGGRNIPQYKDKMVDITEKTAMQLMKMRKGKMSDNGDYLYIDDNQGQWLQYFINDHYHLKGKAKKQGVWSIINRQNWLNQAINSGFIVIDESNTKLIDEIGMSVLANGSDKRDESSTLNKNYDRINSMEYGVYPFHHWIGEYIRNK